MCTISCTEHLGKCELPRFLEDDIALRLGEPLKGLQDPADVVAKIVTALRDDEKKAVDKVDAERSRLQGRLTSIRNRMDQAYTYKFHGVICEEFWRRKTNNWRLEAEQVKMALNALDSAQTGDRAMDAKKIVELANKAYLPYVSQDSTEQAKLLKMVVSTFSVGHVSVTLTYRYPLNFISQRPNWKNGRPFFYFRPLEDQIERFQWAGTIFSASTEKFETTILSSFACSVES